ncbi:hypothetical protein LOAG_16708 [Loa loa]|uniref:Uncharacterized protein n=1 Tax=Loa loa TaxID=7209 RepID=A0A1S0ULL6_LOALO|nr:hypothetical protein LOAG_16708 [Loa loa]EJD76316.1 hypothetical protein LOAG_16708 [Loa loa]
MVAQGTCWMDRTDGRGERRRGPTDLFRRSDNDDDDDCYELRASPQIQLGKMALRKAKGNPFILLPHFSSYLIV